MDGEGGFEIYVRTPKRQTLTLKVKGSTKVGGVKQEVHERTSFPLKQMVLYNFRVYDDKGNYQGGPLVNDDMTLDQEKVTAGRTLYQNCDPHGKVL